MSELQALKLPGQLSERNEEEWERFRVMLEYAAGFWLAFIFAPSSLEAGTLRERTAERMAAEGARMDIWMPKTPDELHQALPWLLSEERAGAGCIWVQSLQVDAEGGEQHSWRDAWMHFFLRANERREAIKRRLAGGLVLALPLILKVPVREAAPDLWSARAIVLELTGTAARGTVERLLEERQDPETAPDAAYWMEEANARQPGSEGRAFALSQAAFGWRADGHPAQGLEAMREVVAIYRDLVRERPDTFLPQLAGSLNDLSVFQNDLDRYEDALASIEEAVAIYRDLVQERPDIFLPQLAASLQNLGVFHGSLGRHEEALASAQEALAIRRDLVQERPDIFLPQLAVSLQNLGACQHALGHHEEALVSTQEALTICRDLAKQQPEAYLSQLHMGLNNLSIYYSNLGRHEEALSLATEAFDVVWKLYPQNPRAFAQLISSSIARLLKCHETLGTLPDETRMTQIMPFLSDRGS